MDGNGSSPLRALVADDHRDSLRAIVLLLQRLGCDVRGCETAPQCIEHAKAHKPQLTLLDLAMPIMDGFAILNRIREPGSPSIIVALTGYGDAKMKARCAEAGFHCHELKPISVGRLRELIEEARRLDP